MTQTITNSGHEDMIHDAQLDYYGRRLATCSSDRTLRLFDIDPSTSSHTLSATLRGHESPVFSLAWAHPKFGAILASASYDGKVILWRETGTSQTGGSGGQGNWTRLVDFALHTAAVNTIAWAPHELGAHLACASSDGTVSVLSFNDSPTAAQGQGQNAWETVIVSAHSIACNSVSWAPSLLPGALEKAASAGAGGAQGGERRFATGGSDGSVKLWQYSPGSNNYEQTVELKGHGDWVRDVAWSPSLLSKTYIASGSQDKSVRIWTFNAGSGDGSAISDAGAWQCSELKFECAVWRVSWSLTGNVLAVSGGDNKVSLWKERVRDGGWECVRMMEE